MRALGQAQGSYAGFTFLLSCLSRAHAARESVSQQDWLCRRMDNEDRQWCASGEQVIPIVSSCSQLRWHHAQSGMLDTACMQQLRGTLLAPLEPATSTAAYEWMLGVA